MNLLHNLHIPLTLTVIFSVFLGYAEDFHPPAGNRYAQIAAAGSVLPGGRLLQPYGVGMETGPGPFAIAVSPKGFAATANLGFGRSGVTIAEPAGKGPFQVRQIWARTPNSTAPEAADPDWKSVSAGIVFDTDKSVWVSEGLSGRIRQLDITTGDHKKIININAPGLQNSFTGDLAYAPMRHLLFAVDRANSRLAVIDARTGRTASSVSLEPGAFALALAPDGGTAYVTEQKAVCFIDVRDAARPAITGRVPVPSPQAVLATDDRVFVSNALDDSISILSAADRKLIVDIPLAIPSLEKYRGVLPAGLAYDPLTKWLLVAESGINTVGVVDTAANEEIGHLPAGLMPTAVAISGDRVFVANAGGRGSGPNPRNPLVILGEPPITHPGSISTFIMPDRAEVLRQTGIAFALEGFVPYMRNAPKLPDAIRHVVLIVKGSATFDSVLGDIGREAAGVPTLAIFGMHGKALGGRTQFSLQDTPITPNLHAIARRWAFNDNFYSNGETEADSRIWLEREPADPARECSIRSGFLQNKPVPYKSDRERADDFIQMLEEHRKSGEALPGLLTLQLPGDRPHEPLPEDGYPYEASFVAANDLATGRILSFLSHSEWWRDMAVFITEDDTVGRLDHLNAQRTVFVAAGPWIRKDYLSHVNADVPAVYRTINELLGTPPRNLAEATAANLHDLFTDQPDFTPFDPILPDRRLYDPALTH